MPSILAFFKDNKSAHSCLLEVRKNIPPTGKAYTVAQHEYRESPNEISLMDIRAQRSKISGKVGGILGLIIGLGFALAVEVDLFSSLGTFTAVLVIVLASAAAGSLIGLFVLSAANKLPYKNDNFRDERGELILIVENPGEKKQDLVDIINKHMPDKLKVY